MRQLSLGVTVVALFGLAACGKNDAAHDDLAADLASVSSSSDLALAPNSAGRTTVSSVEQLAPRVRIAPSRASAPHRTPHVDRRSPRITNVSTTTAPEPEAVPEEMEPIAAVPPEVIAPRPHPVEPSNGAVVPGDGGTGGQTGGGGVDAGQVIGTIFGVVLRGGVADGDHCDPRPGRRGGPHISIGRTIPNVRY